MAATKDWIQTRSGRKFFPITPDPEAIDIGDIAHALSNICRYTGHVSRFYSVAEHSVWVSMFVPAQDALAGLLHDASEAYLCDVARPVKHHPDMSGYRTAEKHLERVILERFGLPGELPKSVHEADNRMLTTEAQELMAPLHPDWKKSGALLSPYSIPGNALGWPPELAKKKFLARFYALHGGI